MKRYHQLNGFNLGIDAITCNSLFKFYNFYSDTFRKVHSIINLLKGRKYEYRGKILGLIEYNVKF